MATRVPILTYHKIAPVNAKTLYPGTFVPPNLFEKHLGFLARKGFETMRLDAIFSGLEPAKPIVLTFDDGFQDFEDAAAPILHRFGYGATVFLVSDFVGKTNEWDENIGDVKYPLMSKESIVRLHEEGYEFGSHSKSHVRLSSHDAVTQDSEIRGSKSDLETMLGFPIQTFCYPYGSYDDNSLNSVRASGYQFATTCDKGLNDGSEDPLRLKRIAIRNDTSLPVFIYKLWRAFRLGR